ncbi:MAG: TlpA family protein disulfide reductase [Bacteroidia bacterium]|nr:TlpA family protein disulfide reductase [Bacteroidia bacterium]
MKFRLWILAFISVGFLTFCNIKDKEKEKNKEIFVKVVIKNPSDSILKLIQKNFVHDLDETDTLKLKNGMVVFQMNHSKGGFYDLEYANETIDLFLWPGDSVIVEFDANRIDSSITFSGKGSVKNNFLSKENLLFRTPEKLIEKEKYFYKSKDSFLLLTQDYYRCIERLLQSYKPETFSDSVFFNLKKRILKYDFCKDKIFYKPRYEFFKKTLNLPDQNYDPDETWLKPFTELNVDDTTMLIYYNFSYFVNYDYIPLYVFKDKYSLDKHTKYIFENFKKIKYPILYGFILVNLKADNFDDLKPNCDTILLRNDIPEKWKSVLMALMKKIEKIRKGADFPSFTFKDSSNNDVLFKHNPNKVMYIDVWATFCKPCMVEWPNYEKLVSRFKDKPVRFVSISMDPNRESWLNYIRKKKLPIEHYIVPENFDSEFAKTFCIDGVPQYIMVDGKGKIFSTDAPRPSSTKADSLLNLCIKNTVQ